MQESQQKKLNLFQERVIMSDNFYRAFEEKYYASREKIKELRKQYLPFIEPLAKFYPLNKTFDAGCGRGEWLELMQEIGLLPYGVDLDEGMLQSCKELNLPASKCDAISYIKTLDSESHLVISAFHVVEHIHFDDLRTLVSEAYRVLKPGGLLIMETPNPENIRVSTLHFYTDPTHIRPIPPNLLSFIPEYYGFKRIKILRLQESKELAKQESASLLQVLESSSPDYAVIAQKDADIHLLQPLSPLFEKEYGLSINSMFDRYEKCQDACAYIQKIKNSLPWKTYQIIKKNINTLRIKLKVN